MLDNLSVELGEYASIRFPNKPIYGFFELEKMVKKGFTKTEIIKELLKDEDFKISLKTASNSLYNNLHNLSKKRENQIEKIFLTVIKYFIRFHTRATPFSTFSTVGVASFNTTNEQSIDRIDNDLIQYKIRISEEWLGQYINLIESDSQVFRYLKLQTNELLYETKTGFYLSYHTGGGIKKDNSIEEIYINKKKLLKIVLDSFKDSKKVDKFVDLLGVNLEKGADEQIIEYLQNLTSKEFLISDLRISNSYENKFERLMEILKDIGSPALKYLSPLLDVQKELENITNLSSQKVDILRSKLEDILKADEYFQVDSIYPKIIKFPKTFKKSLENYAKLSAKISVLMDSKIEYMDFYLNKFLNQYGIFTAIPVKSLIDDKLELGPPPTYSNPIGLLDYEYNNGKDIVRKRSEFFNKIIYETNIDTDSLDISRLMQDEFYENSTIKKGSSDIYVSIYGETEDDIKKGNYTVYPSGNIFSPFAGRTIGRFVDAYEEKIAKNIKKDIFDKESLLNKEEILVNINLSPLNSRANNVMKSSNEIQYEMSFNSINNKNKISIKLEDIYVYSDGSRFLLYSRKLKARIKPMITHMLNHQINVPNIYRFILDIAMNQNTPLQSISGVAELEKHPYIPRIVYENFVLSPKTWNLSLLNKENVKFYIRDFYKMYKIPRFVKINNYDNFIFLDLDSQISVEILEKELVKKGRLQLVEANELEKSSLLKNKHGDCIVNELVYSVFMQNKEQGKQGKQGKQGIVFYDVEKREIRNPKEWIYFKLYYPIGSDYKVLTPNLSNFIESVEELGEIYYIKYGDPSPHIRVRIRVKPECKEILLNKIYSFCEILKEKRLVYKIDYSEYLREIERYGGPKLIGNAEDIFIEDSKVVLKALSLIENSKEKILLAAFVTLQKFVHYFLKEEIIYEWLEKNFTINKKFYHDYRTFIKTNSENTNLLNSLEEGMENLEIFKKWIQKIENYIYKINLEERTNMDNIIASFIHMHLNRYGIHNVDEEKVMNMLYFKNKESFMKERSKALITVME